MNEYTLELEMEMAVEDVELEMEIAAPVIIAPIPDNYAMVTYVGPYIRIT